MGSMGMMGSDVCYQTWQLGLEDGSRGQTRRRTGNILTEEGGARGGTDCKEVFLPALCI